MNAEERHRFDAQVTQVKRNFVLIAQRHITFQQIPIGQLDLVLKRQWAKKKMYDKADARGLTTTELAIQRLGQAEQAKRSIIRLPVQEQAVEETIIVPATLPPAAPIQPAQSIRLPILTPERPRPRRSPSPEATPEGLPPSTAPAQLGRPKRKRKHTTKHVESVEDGFVKASQTGATGTEE